MTTGDSDIYRIETKQHGWMIVTHEHISLVNKFCMKYEMSDIGFFYIEHGHYEEGLSMLNKCLETQKRSLPDDHPSLVATYSHITLGLSKLHRYSEAFDIGMKAFDIATKQLGDEHEQTCYLRAMLKLIADQMELH
ncbi:unnamed protein product [Rotaria magnacalcarata]|uniref:Uncharacterized protein n=3 Tax=Rotaria magnacalcarata TaxID=392030 RepID=A0A814EUE9_9BILA|nr:unnamed protein product [Rotaria magnacalcarata]